MTGGLATYGEVTRLLHYNWKLKEGGKDRIQTKAPPHPPLPPALPGRKKNEETPRL